MNQNNEYHMESILIERIKGGDERAFSQLMEKWQDCIYHYALRYTGRQSMAEEVVQKTFIQVHKHLNNLEDISKFKPWLYRIACNSCISEGRKEQSKKKYIDTMGTLPHQSDRITPHTHMVQDERKALVHVALRELPDEQRQVVIMKEWEGLKFREIAEIMGESESTVKSRMYYALISMRKWMNKYKWTKDLYHG